MLRRGESAYSESLTAQLRVEQDTIQIYQTSLASSTEHDEDLFVLHREKHLKYLIQGLSRPLPEGFISLGASKPWILYWIVHSIGLLGDLDSLAIETRESIIRILNACQHEDGGFGGGPGQLPHVATTYAAVSALVTLGGEDALSIIHREGIIDFFLRMSVPAGDGGGMTMHEGGEIDVRGCYCALSVCYMLCMDVSRVAEACHLNNFVQRCQSYEGGFGGEPGNESHGGYAFCAYAALHIAGMQHTIDTSLLASWLSRMQGTIEGGMKGRTNKLVDGCYSLWQGGLCRIVADEATHVNHQYGKEPQVDLLGCEHLVDTYIRSWIESEQYCDRATMRDEQLQQLQADFDKVVDDCLIAEEVYKNKPSIDAKRQVDELAHKTIQMQEDIRELEQDVLARDLIVRLIPMHAGCGDICDMVALQRWILLACQVEGRGGLRDKPPMHTDFYHTCYCLSGLSAAQWSTGYVLGGEKNRLLQAHSLCNVLSSKVKESIKYFK